MGRRERLKGRDIVGVVEVWGVRGVRGVGTWRGWWGWGDVVGMECWWEEWISVLSDAVVADWGVLRKIGSSI